MFFDVDNWKNGVQEALPKSKNLERFLVKSFNFLKVREMQIYSFRLGGVQLLAKIVCRCWGLKTKLRRVVLGGLLGSKMGSKLEK